MAGIYIHVPFCQKRCIYCDFYSTVSTSKIQAYVKCLKQELASRCAAEGDEPIETVYFGGGTPSILPPECIEEILDHICRLYSLSDRTAEITLEANPDDINHEYINRIRQSGVNRMSIGIQTFNDRQLAFLNRRHSAQQAIDGVKTCQDCGIGNISIDLIYGLPGEDIEDWLRDIDRAVGLGTQHISSYHLTYEPGTRLHLLLQQGKISEIDENESFRQFSALTEKLEQAGFVHYEISNFCKPGYESRHNSSYWCGKKYIGAGPAAHSFDGQDRRRWNIANLDKYMKRMERNAVYWEEEQLGKEEKYNEMIITSLRTRKGLDMQELRMKFGENYYDYCLKNARKYLNDGELMTLDNGIMKLRKRGIFISDMIMEDLMRID